jgi:hypothetical protein
MKQKGDSKVVEIKNKQPKDDLLLLLMWLYNYFIEF